MKANCRTVEFGDFREETGSRGDILSSSILHSVPTTDFASNLQQPAEPNQDTSLTFFLFIGLFGDAGVHHKYAKKTRPNFTPWTGTF